MADIKENKEVVDNNIWSTERVNELIRKIDEEGLDYKAVENPFHDQDPELKKGRILWEYTQDELSEIAKCAADVTYFAKYCQVMTDYGLKYIKLREYQYSVLKEYQNHRKTIFLAPRQIGKCLLPNTIINKKSENVSIDSLKKVKKKSFYQIIKHFLYKIYTFVG